MKKVLLRVGCPVLFFAVCGFVLYPVFERVKENPERPHCQSNLKQMGLAVAQYVQDYGDKYPLVMTSGASFGWADSLQPYLKSTLILRCPGPVSDNRKEVSPRSVGYTDYWYNERLQRLEEKNILKPEVVILFGDGNNGHDGSTARYSLSELPPEWLADKSSPCYRHLDGSNYGFTDGHVKWYTPEKIRATTEKDSPTFAIR